MPPKRYHQPSDVIARYRNNDVTSHKPFKRPYLAKNDFRVKYIHVHVVDYVHVKTQLL